jgi:hypothetical protein
MYKVKNNHMIGHALNASSTWRWRQMPRSQRIDQQRKRVLEVFLTKRRWKAAWRYCLDICKQA